MSYTFIVIETKNIIQEMIDESLNMNDTFRMSLDCTCGILKFSCLYPDTMGGYQKYNHAEILAYLETNTIDWNTEEI